MGAIWYRRRPGRRDWVQRRKSPPKPIALMAHLQSIEDGESLGHCHLLDISDGGAKISVDRPAKFPEHFVLILSTSGDTFRHCQVRWRSATEVGVQFQKLK